MRRWPLLVPTRSGTLDVPLHCCCPDREQLAALWRPSTWRGVRGDRRARWPWTKPRRPLHWLLLFVSGDLPSPGTCARPCPPREEEESKAWRLLTGPAARSIHLHLLLLHHTGPYAHWSLKWISSPSQCARAARRLPSHLRPMAGRWRPIFLWADAIEQLVAAAQHAVAMGRRSG